MEKHLNSFINILCSPSLLQMSDSNCVQSEVSCACTVEYNGEYFVSVSRLWCRAVGMVRCGSFCGYMSGDCCSRLTGELLYCHLCFLRCDTSLFIITNFAEVITNCINSCHRRPRNLWTVWHVPSTNAISISVDQVDIMTAFRGIRGVAPLILTLNTMEVSGCFCPGEETQQQLDVNVGGPPEPLWMF